MQTPTRIKPNTHTQKKNKNEVNRKLYFFSQVPPVPFERFARFLGFSIVRSERLALLSQILGSL